MKTSSPVEVPSVRVVPVEVRAVSVEDVAPLLSVSPDEVWEMVRGGELMVLRRGRRVLVPVSEIDAYIERSKARWSAYRAGA